jgi:rhodanese-related sulfurtransferase
MAVAHSLEITPQEVRKMQEAAKSFKWIDVRESTEWVVSHIEGATLISMNTVPANLQTIEAQADEQPLVVYCHHGVRSLHVVAWLREHGVENCWSMAGGIDRWSREIDPKVPLY